MHAYHREGTVVQVAQDGLRHGREVIDEITLRRVSSVEERLVEIGEGNLVVHIATLGRRRCHDDQVEALAEHAGSWHGSNGFRLMPDDALETRPASARIEPMAGRHVTSVRYTWEHPADGAQDGVLLLWATGDDTAGALWCDSWHQQPLPQVMSGDRKAKTITLEMEYGDGWRWLISIDAGAHDAFRMVMQNVVPGENPYDVMVTDLTRAT